MATRHVKFTLDTKYRTKTTYSDLSNVVAHTKAAQLYAALTGAAYLLLSAFSLLFILSRILYGGFYAGEAHDLAMWSLIIFAVLLFGGAVAYFIVPRIYKRVPAHLLRRLLYLAVLAIAIISMVILGTSAYLLVAIGVGAAVILAEIVRLLHLNGKLRGTAKRNLLLAVLLITLAAVLLGALATAGLTPVGEVDSIVEMSVLSRTVRYELNKDERAVLSKMMLTATDAFGITLADAFTVPDTVTIDGETYAVRVIGSEAFCGVRAFPTVYLPASVREIAGDAFRASSVTELHVAGDRLNLQDGLRDSSILDLYLDYDGVVEVTVNGDLADGLTIHVPRDLIDDYRIANPDYATAFAPIIGEDEVYVNYNITAPIGEGEIAAYIPTVITKAGTKLDFPYDTLRTETDAYGSHFVYEVDGRRFRLLTLTANGEAIDLAESNVTVNESMSVAGAWVEVFSAYADYTAIGGEVVELGEFPVGATSYALPTGVTHTGKVGYVCNAWFDDKTPDTDTLDSLKKSYVLTPKWSLLPAELSVENHTATYDGEAHTLYAGATHALDSVTYTYLWELDGITYSQTEALLIKDVANSGIYRLSVTVTDENGESAVTTRDVAVSIAKAPLTITAEDKSQTYGEAAAPLTYVQTGLLGGDAITGELMRATGDNVGSYAISLGTLSAGENYAVTFTGATYTITKARYDMGGITLPGRTVEYNGQGQHLTITGELPVGLDGIPVTVKYQSIHTAGTYQLAAIFETESQNYEMPAQMTAELVITPKPITVRADPVTITYGDPAVALTYTVEGLVDGDVLEGALSRTTGEAAAAYDILLGTLANPNYDIQYIGAKYTIERADAVIDVSGVLKEYVYTGTEQAVTSGATLNHSEAGLVYTNNTFIDVGTGTYTVTVSVAETTNYNAASVSFDIHVEKAASVIDVEAIEKTFVYTGLAQSVAENATLNHTENLLVYRDNHFTDAGTHTVTVSVEESPNYKAASVSFEVTVERAETVIDIRDVQREYTYTGEEQTVNGATLNHNEAILIYTDNVFTDVGNGRYTVTITAPDTKNYKGTAVTVEITVAKAKVEVPVPTTTTFTYTGEDIVLMEAPADAPYTVSGGVASKEANHLVTLTLKDPANYEWADADFDGQLLFTITSATETE